MIMITPQNLHWSSFHSLTTDSACLQRLLDDFQGPNIDVTAAFVETSGRFLSLIPETQERMENMLKVTNVL